MGLYPPNGNWKVEIINKDWDRWLTNLLIYRETSGDMIRVLYIEDPETWTMKEVEFSAMQADIPPSLRLPSGVIKALMPALQAHGIKPPDEHKIAGLYEATKYHLEDLRKLLNMNGGKVKNAFEGQTIFGKPVVSAEEFIAEDLTKKMKGDTDV